MRENPRLDVNNAFHKELRRICGGDNATYDRFKMRVAPLPYLYGVIKTHKDGNPSRPIISTVNTVTHLLSSYLCKVLEPLVGTISHAHLKNVDQFYEEVNAVIIHPDMVLASFDVENMYTNVPIDMVCDYLTTYLENFALDFEVWLIIAMIRICIVGTCFQFEDQFYKQIYGLQMGAKLSPIIANIALEIFETNSVGDIVQQSVF
ncbi:unnamed protein product [Rotaria magnacalcarata]|nr:unnamed protein product [Rotaria magnacalcarata]